MDVSINQRLKDLEREKDCVRKWGTKMTRRIYMRLDQLRAADNLAVMKNLPGRCHELKGERKGQLAMDLIHPNRLIFKPLGDQESHYLDNQLQWGKVESIEILDIGDYHD